jgi:hypothetical protein
MCYSTRHGRCLPSADPSTRATRKLAFHSSPWPRRVACRPDPLTISWRLNGQGKSPTSNSEAGPGARAGRRVCVFAAGPVWKVPALRTLERCEPRAPQTRGSASQRCAVLCCAVCETCAVAVHCKSTFKESDKCIHHLPSASAPRLSGRDAACLQRCRASTRRSITLQCSSGSHCRSRSSP